ncbi:MAG: MAPEG family protein [Micropepsaceae bacterium]
MSAWPVLVTLGALLFYFWTSMQVGGARRKYNIPAPAVSGNADFERVFRVQMNTLEWLPLFLGSLWIFTMYWDDRVAALIGAVWIVGRALYAHGYAAAADQRSTGFMIQGIAVIVLFVGGLVGAVMSLFGAT